MKKIISTVIPVYNTRPYLSEAINSILVQKDYLKEIIIINDGSTDGSKEYLLDNFSKNNLIKIINTENLGQGNARNIGIKEATGKFIYFFDSDDISDRDLFKQFYNSYYNNKNLELFCFSGESFLDKSTCLSKLANKSYINENFYLRKVDEIFEKGEDAFVKLSKNKSFFAGPPLYIVQKECLIKNNLFFLKIKYEDEEFTSRLFLKAKKTIVTNSKFFYRRVREDSTMQKKRTFSDILGYFTTIKTLQELNSNENFSLQTKEYIEKRIIGFTKTIIDLKIKYDIKFSYNEKKIFKRKIMPLIKKDKNLKKYYYLYPIEFSLRKLKKKILLRKTFKYV